MTCIFSMPFNYPTRKYLLSIFAMSSAVIVDFFASSPRAQAQALRHHGHRISEAERKAKRRCARLRSKTSSLSIPKDPAVPHMAEVHNSSQAMSAPSIAPLSSTLGPPQYLRPKFYTADPEDEPEPNRPAYSVFLQNRINVKACDTVSHIIRQKRRMSDRMLRDSNTHTSSSAMKVRSAADMKCQAPESLDQESIRAQSLKNLHVGSLPRIMSDQRHAKRSEPDQTSSEQDQTSPAERPSGPPKDDESTHYDALESHTTASIYNDINIHLDDRDIAAGAILLRAAKTQQMQWTCCRCQMGPQDATLDGCWLCCHSPCAGCLFEPHVFPSRPK